MSFIKKKCCDCKNFIPVVSATINDNKLILNIPSAIYKNAQQVCLFIAQNLPVSTTPIPVYITIGEDATEYMFLNKNGNSVYSDQLSNRCMYETSIRTDTKLFKYNECKNLPCTSFVFPIITPTVPTPQA